MSNDDILDVCIDDTRDGECWSGSRPISNPYALRRLIHRRLTLGETPLPEGFPLPTGITLEDLLKMPPPAREFR